MMIRRVLPLLLAVGVLAACGSTTDDAASEATDRAQLSGLPALVSTTAPGAQPPSTGVTPADGPLGSRVAGNKVILIGDSVLAGTATRYGGEMCEALVPLDWRVELDAETGRFVEWGNEVLDAREDAGWDVAVIMLGNNFLGDKELYKFELERMVNRLSPMPVVLIKVSLYRKDRALVNEAIDEIAAAFPDRVELIDWTSLVKADEELVGRDKLHPSDKGRALLAAEVARVLGQAPVSPGSCLPSDFTDDSRGAVTGGGGGGGGGGVTTTVGGPGTTAGTTPPTTDPPETVPPPDTSP